jgi:sirohydrochlorin cobaltochelatase
MNDTILLVGHGSRERRGNDEIEAFAEQWRARRPGWRIDVCFIEFAEVMLDEGLRRAAQGSTRVLVLPLILNAAGHVKMEIPEHIEAARTAHPQVSFLYAPHLSACDPILAVLQRELRKAMATLDMPDPTTTGVVLLARGSSDRQANGDMAKMARWLMEEGDHELVDLAFTGITWPRLERVVQRQVQLGMRQVVVLPYYLFTGTLIERIERQVEHLRQQYPQVRFAGGRYFGFEREVVEVLEQRIDDLRDGAPAALMPCDGCKFRAFAQAHGMGHHHHGDATPHAAVATVRALPTPDRAGAGGHSHDHGHRHEHVHEHNHEHGHDHARDHSHGQVHV